MDDELASQSFCYHYGLCSMWEGVLCAYCQVSALSSGGCRAIEGFCTMSNQLWCWAFEVQCICTLRWILSPKVNINLAIWLSIMCRNRLTDKKEAAEWNLERCIQSENNESKYKGWKIHSVYFCMFACWSKIWNPKVSIYWLFGILFWSKHFRHLPEFVQINFKKKNQKVWCFCQCIF